eukprot:2056546-Amphidinium_carterae.2
MLVRGMVVPCCDVFSHDVHWDASYDGRSLQCQPNLKPSVGACVKVEQRLIGRWGPFKLLHLCLFGKQDEREVDFACQCECCYEHAND